MDLVDWKDLKHRPPDPRSTALTIGVFDGVHRGHRTLIGKITAKAPELLPAVVTFRENPKKIARPGSFEGDITGFEEKLALIRGCGAELCVIIDFSRDFSTMDGRSFMEALRCFLNPAYIAVGAGFRCGYRRDTGAPAFKALGNERGIEVEIVEPVMEGGLPVSSSRIRAALREGRSAEAEKLLGRAVETAECFNRGFKE
ncbi:MAG: FAD synthetase family protein [Treponema sp.]|jgi:riboflavin kinase/FMN adenylyltransferase|nr:FAD synthetase family protein [Treponema sp.]